MLHKKFKVARNKFKSPLRYPGAKTKSVEFLRQRFYNPIEGKQYREAFLGGGSMAIEVTKYFGPSVSIWVNDLNYPLYCFWMNLQNHSERMIKDLYDIKDKMMSHYKEELWLKEDIKEIFIQSQEISKTSDDPYLMGLHFYVANKCSFSGLTQIGSYSHSSFKAAFSREAIKELTRYSVLIQNWKITNLDYSELLDGDDAFVFLDPPYEIGDNFLYGKGGDKHKGFDHDDFAKKCSESSNKIMITYNSDSKIKERFQGWNTEEWDLTYTMRSVGDYMKEQKNRKELLLTNYTRYESSGVLF